MYSVQPRITDNYATNASLNATLDAIEYKIKTMALCRYNHIKYDVSCDCDLDLYDDLTTYKQILIDKLLGCQCLDNQKLIKIISRIKRLLK